MLSVELESWQKNAGLPHPPTPFTLEYRKAIQGEGPHAFVWKDKPHRLVFDLCRHIEQQAALRATEAQATCPVCKQADCCWGGVPANCQAWGKSALVQVTDADRKAADRYSSMVWCGEGRRPETPLDRAFARHRALGIAQGRTKAEAEIVALREQARKEAAMLREIAKSEARGLDWQANLTATADFLERLEHKEPRP